MTEWCAGLPLESRRPLDDEERCHLLDEARRYRWRGIGVLLLYPPLVIAFSIAVGRADPSSSTMRSRLAVAVILLAAIGLAALIVLVRDTFRRSRRLFRDLRFGEVKRFAGPLRPEMAREKTVARFLKAGLFSNVMEEESSLEVLPASGRVWRAGDRPVSRWIEARSTEVAETPAIAAVAAKRLEPIEGAADVVTRRGSREMSPQERDELSRLAGRLWRRRLPVAIGITLCPVVLAAILLARGRLASTGDWIGFALLAAVTLGIDRKLARTLALSRQFVQDAKAGTLMIVSFDIANPRPERSGGDDRRSDGERTLGNDNRESSGTGEITFAAPNVVELLAVSRWIWTTDGRPTPWRIARTL